MRSVYPNRRGLSSTKEKKPLITSIEPQESSIPSKKPRSYRECFYPAQVVPAPSTSVIFSRRSTLLHERRECSVRAGSRPSAFGRQLSLSPSPQKRMAGVSLTAASRATSASRMMSKRETTPPDQWRRPRSASAMEPGSAAVLMPKSRAGSSCTRGTSPPPPPLSAEEKRPPPLHFVSRTPAPSTADAATTTNNNNHNVNVNVRKDEEQGPDEMLPGGNRFNTSVGPSRPIPHHTDTAVSMELSAITGSSHGDESSHCWTADGAGVDGGDDTARRHRRRRWAADEEGEESRSPAAAQSDLLLRASPIRKNKETQAAFLSPREVRVASHFFSPQRSGADRWGALFLDTTKLELESERSVLSSVPPSPPIQPTPVWAKADAPPQPRGTAHPPGMLGPALLPQQQPPHKATDSEPVVRPPTSTEEPAWVQAYTPAAQHRCGGTLPRHGDVEVPGLSLSSIHHHSAPSRAVESCARSGGVIAGVRDAMVNVQEPPTAASNATRRRATPPSPEIVYVEAIETITEALPNSSPDPLPCSMLNVGVDKEGSASSRRFDRVPVTATRKERSPAAVEAAVGGNSTALSEQLEAVRVTPTQNNTRQCQMDKKAEDMACCRVDQPDVPTLVRGEIGATREKKAGDVTAYNDIVPAAEGEEREKEEKMATEKVRGVEEETLSSATSSKLPRQETRRTLRFDPSLFIVVPNPREYVQEANFRVAFTSFT